MLNVIDQGTRIQHAVDLGGCDLIKLRVRGVWEVDVETIGFGGRDGRARVAKIPLLDAS